jgi:hypothetical protein
MEEFELKLRISPSDSQFRNLIGPDAYTKLKAETFKRDRYTCQGCGFKPLDENKALVALKLHVIDINEEKPTESPCNVLCMACHSTQHIDVAIEKDWVQLVNSTYSQKSLIEKCRINMIQSMLTIDDTRTLKTTPLDFLRKMKTGELTINSKAKVIFTSKFEWGDL